MNDPEQSRGQAAPGQRRPDASDSMRMWAPPSPSAPGPGWPTQFGPPPGHGSAPGPGPWAPARPEPYGAAAPTPPSTGRRWPWIVGIVAAFLVGLVIPTGGTSTPPPPAVSAPSPLPGGTSETTFQAPFTLEASSQLGREMRVSYSNGTGGTDSAPSGTFGTWSTTVPDDGEQFASGYLSVSSSPSVDEYIQGDPASDTVTCRVTDATGAVVEENSATGQSANASCSGF